MLQFNAEIKPDKIELGEESRIMFNFRNDGDNMIHCVSYKITVYSGGIIVKDFPYHDFVYDLPPNSLWTIKQWGMVNPIATYMNESNDKGLYRFLVALRYFECGGGDKVNTVQSIANLSVK